MKTITMKEDGQSTYAFDDDAQIVLGDIGTLMPDGSTDITVTVETAILWEGIALPEDWDATKYCFDGTSWTANPLFAGLNPSE